MIYINTNTGKRYYGGAMTRTLEDGSLWSGVPTPEQLAEWGYEEYVPPTYEPTEEELNQISAEEALDIITNGE